MNGNGKERYSKRRVASAHAAADQIHTISVVGIMIMIMRPENGVEFFAVRVTLRLDEHTKVSRGSKLALYI